MNKMLWIGIGCLMIALSISLHHFIISGKFYDIDDMLHHEFFLALFMGAGLGVLLQTIVKPNQN